MTTDRLLLRRFTLDDAERLYELDGDPEVMRYLTGGSGTPREVIENVILPRFIGSTESSAGFGFWATIERATGGFLGWFSLRQHDENRRAAELGYRLRRAAWGQGYATEGARALIDLAFTALDVQRVVATTYEENRASRRVMEKAGMTLARRFRMTPAALAAQHTLAAATGDVWDGDDVEYALERAVWERAACDRS